MTRTARILSLLLWLLPAGALLQAQTSARISTQFLARGEKALLEISTIGGEADDMPEIPRIRDVDISPAGYGAQARLLPGRRLEYSFQYIVSSYEIGRHVIPSVNLVVNGETVRTEPIEFRVFDPDELETREASIGGRTFLYSAAFHTMKDQVFEGETIATEIKIYVPRELAMTVQDWGIPEFERDGVAAWRFEPTAMRGQVNLRGNPYISLAYPSTMSATRTGTVGIGPATVRLTTQQVMMDGTLRRVFQEVNLAIPKREVASVPLPAGAPEGFENAIGRFTLEASAPGGQLDEGNPVSVDLTVRGTGNLDALRPPKLVDEDGWKTYEATADQRGDERRQLSGSVVFRQFMRPLELKSMIPPFRLVYFDPESGSYHTVSTEPIPLDMRPSPGAPLAMSSDPPPALPIPVERMTDILGILDTSSPLMATTTPLPAWTGHAVGGFLALVLLIKAFWMRLAPRFRKDPARVRRIAALGELSRTKNSEDDSFLRAAGGYIERWLGDARSTELQAILAERDAVCFRTEKPARVLDGRRRDEILRTIRKAAVSCIVFAFCLLTAQPALAEESGSRASAAASAYEDGEFQKAIGLWHEAGDYEQLSPDVLYNIGNACYRLGSPGHAALYFHRALARDPGHQEARQNLRFIERKHGSITVTRPDYQYAIARLPLAAWRNTAWAGAWLIVLGILVFPATRPGDRLRVGAISALVAGPLIAAIGALGWHYFPDDARFASRDRQAVIIADKAVLHSDAARTAPEVIDAPPGSLCEIIRINGRWAYVSFATKTRGWLPVESIEKVHPEETPEAPEIRKKNGDSTTT